MDLALQHTLLLTAAGMVVGIFGALLGIGGGVFLVPVLVLMVHVPIHEAIGTSLVCVIATSSAVAATNLERGLVNIGLGTTLELATTTGGICGGITANLLAAQQLMIIFAITLVVVAALMGLKQRMVLKNPRTFESDRGLLGGDYTDPASGREVGYRLRRFPAALGTSFVAGNVSGLLGIGGSILTVPSLNLFNGVPMKAATATGNFMIGVTAVASAFIFYRRGQIKPEITALVAVGVLVGSLLGIRLNKYLRATWIRAIFIVVMLLVAGQMLLKALR